MRKRTERYWYEDGIWEIGFGLTNLILAGYFTLTAWIQAQNFSSLFIVALELAVLLGIFWLMGQMIRLLKERITYPRTGYVAYRKHPLKKRFKRIVLIGLLSAGIGITLTLVSASSSIRSTVPLITGVVMSGMMVYLGHRYDLLRMVVLALLTLILSLLLAFIPISAINSQAVFFASYGLLFLVSGGVTLAAYLRRTCVQAATDDYEVPASLEEN
jgi:hypothetical protein